MVPELRPRGIGEILDSAVALYRARFTKLTLIAAAVVVPVQFLEGVGVSAAISRSVKLTKPHAMHVLGLVATAQLLAAILNGALAEAVRLVVRSGGSTVAVVIGQSIASTIAGILTTPFVATAIVVLYFDLRIRDEAFDVQLLMQRNDARIAA